MTRSLTMIVVAMALAVSVGRTEGKLSPEGKCLKGRYEAVGKYTQCHQKLVAKYLVGIFKEDVKFQAALSKCRTKYTATWLKLEKMALGTGGTCDRPRFEDNGDGTVTDWLTGLQWERKTNDGTVHDLDNVYSWSAGPSAANGTAFTDFLFQLDFPLGCFAGQCDWRLPTLAELQTILSDPYPCATSPCVDQAAFGPTIAGGYWSATTYATAMNTAWFVDFSLGSANISAGKFVNAGVRAVRAGL